MEPDERERARRWLAEAGVTETGDGHWADASGKRLTGNDVAHGWASEALAEPEAVPLAFGLLDLLNDYWVTCEMRFAMLDGSFPDAAFWDGYRRRLERPEEPEAILYSLWVDWFEDGETVQGAFGEVLGTDIPGEMPPPVLLRVRRVLENSGPVPWEIKSPALRSAAASPALRDAVFRALLTGYHDFYGGLVPDEALGLLEGLGLPPETEHLGALREVLAAGHQNHYRSPEAWDEVRRAGPPG